MSPAYDECYGRKDIFGGEIFLFRPAGQKKAVEMSLQVVRAHERYLVISGKFFRKANACPERRFQAGTHGYRNEIGFQAFIFCA